MNRSELLHYLTDPRGPEEVLPELTTGELVELLDALYQNLDTRDPDFGAQVWYEMGVEESSRRAVSPDGAAHGVA
ncbi:hypothetical protein QF031_003608 [Pseudarthrobacter defluvii]|uniref:hypothetical protein n=1 Tax=Pseudarthrobacter defluvii TaxID=410837 RepID=UPI002789F2C0|nr:hypothetical protein [Pseudarthrobacter defluvii]MDQ0770859.1 hypothetical protein [Pseudarthrobacter defluvii]